MLAYFSSSSAKALVNSIGSWTCSLTKAEGSLVMSGRNPSRCRRLR